MDAVSFNYDKTTWVFLDSGVQREFATLQKQIGGAELSVLSRTVSDKAWIVAAVVDDGPVKFYRYDRRGKGTPKATFLFSNRPAIENLKLSKMHAREIKSRDGLTLMSYLTLPVGTDIDGDGKPTAALPLVLFVHGGPWARDTWGLNGYHQWLASRGYAVLSVNYRGSTGFGKNFTNAGNKERAGKMHEDLLDAVAWAIQGGITSKDKVAIMGGSYRWCSPRWSRRSSVTRAGCPMHPGKSCTHSPPSPHSAWHLGT